MLWSSSLAESRPHPRGVGPRFSTGSLGVFWFLGSEFAIFTGLAIVFLAGRTPEWVAQRVDARQGLAALGTLALLASCGTLARAFLARRGHSGRIWLGATLVFGVAFLGCTGAELASARAHGHGLGAAGYWAHWFLLTGMHATRVLAGVLVLAFVIARRGAERHLGAVGLYWIFVCLVWFAYFPLLYIGG